MVDKQPQSPSKQIQGVLQIRGATVSANTIRCCLNEIKRYGSKSGWHSNMKSQTGVCQNVLEKAKISGRAFL